MSTTPVTSECFAPWYEALGKYDRPQFCWKPQSSRAAPDQNSVLWVSVNVFSAERNVAATRLRLVCEAFSLLNLLARLDIGLWKSTLRKVWPDFVMCEWFEIEETPLEVPVLGLGCVDDIERATLVLRDASKPKRASQDYDSLRIRLEEAVGGETADTDVPLRVELACYMLHPRAIKAVLNNTMKLIDFLGPRSQSTRSTRLNTMPTFHFAEVYFTSTTSVAIDIDGLKLLRKIADRGIFFNVLPSLRSSDWHSLHYGRIPKVISSPADIVDMLRSLLLSDDDQKPRVRKAVVADHFIPSSVPAILSAVQDSQSVECVEINLGDNWDSVELQDWISRPPRGRDRQLEWAQIAYALFSKHASHNIERLELKVTTLQIREVEAVRRILDANNPLAVLDNKPDVMVTDRPTRIKASRFRLEDPDRPDPQALAVMSRNSDIVRKLSFSTPDPQHVRVIQAPDSNDPFKYWTVWLPGHGKAWVHSNDVQSSDFPPDLPVSQYERPKFPRIDVVEMSPSSADAVVDLLEIIGHDTRYIHYSATDVDPPLIDGWCRHVLSVCPKLERLDLGKAALGSLGLFVDSAEAGRCRLRELHGVSISTEDTDSIVPFLRALADPTHPQTTHLEFLNIRLVMEAATTDTIIKEIRDMLRSNRRLRKVHVSFHTTHQSESEDVQHQYTLSIAVADTGDVFIRRAPFESRKKCAFLSVVANTEIKEGDDAKCRRALSCLDTSVIAIVFQFAANGCARDVRVSFTYEHLTPESDSDESEEDDVDEVDEEEEGDDEEDDDDESEDAADDDSDDEPVEA